MMPPERPECPFRLKLEFILSVAESNSLFFFFLSFLERKRSK